MGVLVQRTKNSWGPITTRGGEGKRNSWGRCGTGIRELPIPALLLLRANCSTEKASLVQDDDGKSPARNGVRKTKGPSSLRVKKLKSPEGSDFSGETKR